MRSTLAVTLVLAAGILAGCGQEAADSVPEVASVAAPSTGTAAPAAQRAPVIRPDTTLDEEKRLRQPWMRCLRDQGLPMTTTADGLLDLDARGDTMATNGRLRAGKDPAVKKACDKLKPVLAPELDEARNPYYADDDENYHRCLVKGGKPLVKKDGGWVPGPGFNDWKPDERMETACQATAFDGKKG